jgi:hypothetical protein
MISDVPGYTWGTVTAMAHAGIKYFSIAPDYFDRIGDILFQWEIKPFWWIGPNGQSKVLVWIPFWGYAMSHRYGQMSDAPQAAAGRGGPFQTPEDLYQHTTCCRRPPAPTAAARRRRRNTPADPAIVLAVLRRLQHLAGRDGRPRQYRRCWPGQDPQSLLNAGALRWSTFWPVIASCPHRKARRTAR